MDRKVRLPSINLKKSVHFDGEELYGEDEDSIMALLSPTKQTRLSASAKQRRKSCLRKSPTGAGSHEVKFSEGARVPALSAAGGRGAGLPSDSYSTNSASASQVYSDEQDSTDEPDAFTNHLIQKMIRANQKKITMGEMAPTRGRTSHKGKGNEPRVRSPNGFGLRLLSEILDFPIHYGGLSTAENVLRPQRKFIDLSGRDIKEFPKELWSFRETEELHVENNKLKLIPDTIELLPNLKKLCCQSNEIERVSEGISTLSNLLILDFSNNPNVRLPNAAISKLVYLTELRLARVALKKLPLPFCRNMLHLTLLDLSGNYLTGIPVEINRLRRLKELRLSDNQIDDLVTSICSIPTLEFLYCDGNELQRIPNEISELVNLHTLSLARNSIKTLPDSIGDMMALEVLDISNNLVETLCEGLTRADTLRELAANNNAIDKLPANMHKLVNLEVLQLRNNLLTQLPNRISRHTNMRQLDVSGNRLKSLPMNICGLIELEILSLDENRLTSLPQHFPNLRKLQILGISRNNFDIFPSAICQLTALEKLYMGQDRGTKFSRLPDQIQFLRKLKELYVENNLLLRLPESIGHLSHLEVLDCSNNRMASLPASLYQLKELRVLRLSSNDLTSVDSMIINLTELQELKLDNNSITQPPQHVCELGVDSFFEYLTALAELNKAQTKISAWWRGLMVRRGLGRFAGTFAGKGASSSKKKKK